MRYILGFYLAIVVRMGRREEGIFNSDSSAAIPADLSKDIVVNTKVLQGWYLLSSSSGGRFGIWCPPPPHQFPAMAVSYSPCASLNLKVICYPILGLNFDHMSG